MHWRARVVGAAAVASVAAALVLTFLIARDDTSAGVRAGGDGAAARPATTATTSRPSSSTSTTTTNPRGSGKPVTLALAGDVHFEGELRGKLAADPGSVLGPIAPVLQAADLAVVNLETAITERGEPAPKQFTFRAPASAFTALAAAGVDVASMANNHGLDYGPVGLEETLTAAAEWGFPVIGIGRDASQAYAPYRAVIDGQRIAVLAATQVLDGNLIEAWTATDTRPGLASAKEVDRLVAAVTAARATSDTVVVFLHWGIEKQECPSAAQQELARRLVSAGADVVVGGHAHRLQGAGRLDGALVAYGLGNFAFYAKPGPGASSGVLLVTVTGREIDSYEWRPAVIRGGVPHPLDGEEAAAAVARWDGLRGCAGLEP